MANEIAATKAKARISAHNVRVGLMSRIDYGSPGYREGLVQTAHRIFAAEDTHWDELLGGLVSGAHLKVRMKQAVQDARGRAQKEVAAKKAKGHKGAKLTKVYPHEIESKTIDEVVEELAKQIPVRYKKGSEKPVRLYIMTSPVYDGPYGPEIARRLSLKREDIRYWAKPYEHMPLKPPPHKNFQEIVCIVPSKQHPFRITYDSTPVDREVADYLNAAQKRYADVIVTGCFGSAYLKPMGGESVRPIVSVPNLHRIEDNRASENQIGVSVMEMTTDGQLFVRTHNLNDLVLRERESINISQKFGGLQRRILEQFRTHSWRTLGLLDEDLPDVPSDKIEKALKGILKAKRIRPPLACDPASDRYFIPRTWIQENLSYPYPWPNEKLEEERLLGFGCMHALCVHTVHQFMVTEVPRLILKHDVTTLVGAGDFIEGREHRLQELGEVVAGATYTDQEQFAAWVVGELMLRVFESRLAKATQELGRKPTTDDVLSLIRKALLAFVYIPGNHDDWLKKYAVESLMVFRYELLSFLRKGIAKIFAAQTIPTPVNLDRIVEEKVTRSKEYTLPSGVDMGLSHLHMARTKTKTIRSQEIIDTNEHRLNMHANFHVALAMQRYEPELGQRVVSQFGTLKTRSGFEDSKGKKVDFGVGYVRLGVQKGRIIMSETAFFGGGTTANFQSFDNTKIFAGFAREIGIREL